ncbi:MAG: hypothetical protein ACFFE4_17365 [Candidatus Thorarchaeota archaeon]
MPKTKKQILRRLNDEGIKYNYRLFISRQEWGFIPDPVGADGKELLYPDYTVDLLRHIETSKNSGETLEQIKKRLDERTEERLKICKILGAKDEGQSFQRHYLEKGFVILSFYRDRVVFYLVDHPDGLITYDFKLEVVKQKSMSLKEYSNFVAGLALEKAKESKILSGYEIIDAVFF